MLACAQAVEGTGIQDRPDVTHCHTVEAEQFAKEEEEATEMLFATDAARMGFSDVMLLIQSAACRSPPWSSGANLFLPGTTEATGG